MRLYVDNKNFKRSDLELVTELLFIYPLLSQQAKDYINNNRFWESGIFDGLEKINYACEQECDYFGMPFKFTSSKEDRFLELLEKANKHNKKLICLNNDDFGGDYELPDNVVLFRTSFYKSQRKNNESSFPVFIPDLKKYSSGYSMRDSVGFCGDSNRPVRKEALSILKNSDIYLDHVEVFSFFQNPSVNKKQGRENFLKNLEENAFILCPRGCGNFSYRFYETMAYGRIPVYIDTDSVLPFENLIDYREEIVYVDEKDLDKLPEKIKEYKEKYDGKIVERQQRCREIWENYLSPNGFLKNMESCL